MIQKFQNLIDSLEKSSFQGSVAAMTNINRIPASQLTANKSTLQPKIAALTTHLSESIPRIYKVVTKDHVQRIMSQLGRLRKTLSPILSPIQVSQMQYLVTLGGQTLKEKTSQKMVQGMEKSLQNSILKDQTKVDSDKINLKLATTPQNSVLYEKADTTIQSQISPIVSYLSRSIDPIVPQSVPQSVQILAKYAQSQGRKGFGTITSSKGRSYIGVGQSPQGYQNVTVPFPIQKGTGNTPNLLANFRYYAGQAINSWNDFVKKEQNFVDYIQQISTKELRKNFVQQRISQMTLATFSAQALATLTYYYVQIPLQKFLRLGIQQYDGTRSSFQLKYQPGDGSTRNPFLLNQKDALTIFRLLFQTQNPLTIEAGIALELKKMKNSINSQKINEWLMYSTHRSTVARQFFQTSGLQPDQYQRNLVSPSIVGVKKKKFVVPSMFVNSEVVEMLNKVQSKEKGISNNPTQWSLNWGDDQIMCHDYVWNYDL